MSNRIQSVCRLSRRWHQQFCHSPTFTAHQRCMTALQPIREYRQATRTRRPRPAPLTNEVERNLLEDLPVPEKSDIVVREYEQDEGNKDSLRRVDPNSEINNEITEVRAQMEKLEQELAIMRQGPFGPQSEFFSTFPKDEREQLLKALRAEGALPGEQEDLLSIADLERAVEEDEAEDSSTQRQPGITLRIPKKDQAYVRHFNKALRVVQEAGSDAQKSLVLWTWYLRCQQQIHNFSMIVSEDVWKTLWKSQAELKVRPRHLVMLAKDMLTAEVSLEPTQWISYIEALHSSGDLATAIDVWTDQKALLKTHSEVSNSYWTIGVKLFAAVGRPMKAQELAFNAIYNTKADARILVPVIVAWAKSQTRDGLVKSWACYLALRQRLGNTATPEVFEDISNAFLSVDCADMALSVFKDMLLMRDSSSHDSQAVYKQATKHIIEVMDNAATEEQINRVGLSALLVLPKSFQNRFFFASWIKKLIGEGRVDAAVMVVELMYERGIAPDAKPLNGIVGAWLRDGSPTAQKKAEQMAWSMIDARADLVKNRSISALGDHFRKLTPQRDAGDTRPMFIRRLVPCATIETFSIMLLHYTRRSNYAQAEQLTETMTKDCQMKPNAFIMNHWLYADLRASRLQEVWNKYRNLKVEITPDLETFAALWDTAKVQYSPMKAARASDFPSARQLFAEMIAWSNAISPSKLNHAIQDVSSELYEQIIRCFSISTDLPGTLCAIHGLHQTFKILPDDNSIRLICGQVSRLIPQTQDLSNSRTKSSSPRIRRSHSRHRNILSKVADIVETIEARQKMDLVDKGADARAVQDPHSDISKRLRLDVMTEFMCMFMQKTQRTDGGSYTNDIYVAAKSMGVSMDGIDLSVSSNEEDT